jgi:hypothetical protein
MIAVIIAFWVFLVAAVNILSVLKEESLFKTTTTIIKNKIIQQTPTVVPRAAAVGSFTECMLKLEQYLDPLILQWYEASLPMPISVKIIDNTYYVLLNLNSMHSFQFRYWRKGAKYLCNNVEGGIAMEVTKYAPATLIVQCPSIVNASMDILGTFAIVPVKGDAYSNVTVVTYNMTMFVECERLDIQAHDEKLFSSSLLSSSVVPSNHSDDDTKNDTIKVGITATFMGSRKTALEWAIYHYLIGFDHIWIYINDEWNDGQDLPVRDYITWIPWNYNTHHYNKTLEKKYCAFHEIFRPPSQNDALWRARRLGFDWMAFPDLDEFVVVVKNGKRCGGGGHDCPLKDYLVETHHKTTQQGRDMYDGIMLRSVPFGGSSNAPQSNGQQHNVELILDYTWRPNVNLTEWWASRNKLLVRVPRVTTVNIHYIGDPGGTLHAPPATEIRVNHYKQPERGVFNGRRVWYTIANNQDDIVQDTTLRDDYRDWILSEMMQNGTTTTNAAAATTTAITP